MDINECGYLPLPQNFRCKPEIIGKNPNGLMRLVKPLHWDDYDVIT